MFLLQSTFIDDFFICSLQPRGLITSFVHLPLAIYLHWWFLHMLLATEGFDYFICSCSSCNLPSLMISSCNPRPSVVSSFSLDLGPSLLYLSLPLVGCFVLLTLGRFSSPLQNLIPPKMRDSKDTLSNEVLKHPNKKELKSLLHLPRFQFNK